MKFTTLPALVLLAVSLAPTMANAEEGTRQEPGASDFGKHGFEHREQRREQARHRFEAMHSARTKIMDQADACLARAATAAEARACVKTERGADKAMREQMRERLQDHMEQCQTHMEPRAGGGRPEHRAGKRPHCPQATSEPQRD